MTLIVTINQDRYMILGFVTVELNFVVFWVIMRHKAG